MRNIERDSNNCFINDVRCSHLLGRARCELLKSDVITINQCPGFFLSLDQLEIMDFRSMIHFLGESQRIKDRLDPPKRPLPPGVSASYDHIPPEPQNFSFRNSLNSALRDVLDIDKEIK